MARWTLVSAAAPAPELKREQDYLGAAREALARMREQTLSLKVQAHDPISAEHLARTLHLRAASLQDDPSTTLFFGRIDTDTDERWYIGRRHVADTAGDPLVIDWRAGHVDGVLPRLPHRADGGGAAPPVRAGPRRHHRLRGRAPPGPRRARRPQPDPGRGDRAPPRRARCATSSPPSSPSRTRSSGPAPTRRSASRAHRAPARPRWACTVRPGCSTPSATGWPAPASSSSAPTAPSSSTSARCSRRSARWPSATPPSRSSSPRCRSAAPTAPKPLSSKAMRASPRCSGMPCGRPCSAPPSRSWCRAVCASGASRHTRSTRSSTS